MLKMQKDDKEVIVEVLEEVVHVLGLVPDQGNVEEGVEVGPEIEDDEAGPGKVSQENVHMNDRIQNQIPMEIM